MKYALVSLLALTLLAGCGKDDPAPAGGGGSSTPSTPTSKYGTPEDLAKTVVASCKASDWKALSECCSPTARGIGELRDMKLSEGDKKGLSEGIGGAVVGATEKAADGKTATVELTVKRGDEERKGKIKMELIGTEWKLTDLK